MRSKQVVITSAFFHIPFIFLLPSDSTSAGWGSLPYRVTQTFIPVRFESLVVFFFSIATVSL